jgi:hypothetical protein
MHNPETVNGLRQILEAFAEREEPHGVAFVMGSVADVTLGRSPDRFLHLVQSVDGFVQVHLENSWVSVYASSFGRGRLIVQFPFQEEESPPRRPWLAFVRLAMDVQRFFDDPNEPEPPPRDGAPVVRPLAPGPHSRLRAAEAPLPVDDE